MPRKWTPELQAKKRERRRLKRLRENPDWTPEKAKAHHFDGKGRIVTVNFGTPEQMAEAFDVVNTPFASLEAAAKKVGLPESVLKALKGRLRARFQPLNQELREQTTKGFLAQMEDRLDRALHYLDDYVLSAASAKDLAVVIGILTEKRQLLRGEPTQILSTEERQTLNVLIPVVIREAQRRGITIDMAEGEVRVLGGRPLPGLPKEILGER